MNKEKAILMVYALLAGASYSHEDLITLIKNNLRFFPEYKDLTNDEAEEIAYAYEVEYGTKTFEPGYTLNSSKASETWFHKKKASMLEEEHRYQERYAKYLILEHYGDYAKNSIISEAEKVLSLCADPESNEKNVDW